MGGYLEGRAPLFGAQIAEWYFLRFLGSSVHKGAHERWTEKEKEKEKEKERERERERKRGTNAWEITLMIHAIFMQYSCS
jgi:hypothetical protein